MQLDADRLFAKPCLTCESPGDHDDHNGSAIRAAI